MAVGTCAECGENKELKNRRICEACKKRQQREKLTAKQESRKNPGDNPEGVLHDVPNSPLTDTDLDFQAEYQAAMADVRPDLDMSFGTLRKGVACRTCGVKFDTHLPLARFCSVDCKNEALNHLAGQKK